MNDDDLGFTFYSINNAIGDARDTPQVNKYKSLAKWIQRQQAKMADNTLSADQLKRLVDLGVKPAENVPVEPQDRKTNSGSLGGCGGTTKIAAAVKATGGEDGIGDDYEPTESQKMKWETKFKELQQFHAKNGHRKYLQTIEYNV